MVSTFPSIPGYRISEELYNGSRTLVYRGYRETDLLPVVIKLLKNPYPSFSELLSFRNQYTITKNLNSPLIVQTYSLQAYQNGYTLVMEHFGGISLKEWGMGGSVEFLMEFLEIAIALCNTLNVLYRSRIIHKDIKPANILINPETKEVKLIDFSIASLLPRETQILINPNVLEGTLSYISPEQTGRMNRGIDYRTDFYSLGVTFYELLTGELPFQSNDPMELVHCHIAKAVPLVHRNNLQIPYVFSDIINKLMAKNAEDRYQSALGLKYDLEICLTQLQETGKINKFKIAQRDVCDGFIIPDKLYGRESEVETLIQAFERVSLGVTEMMLIAGFSGIGKTAVVNEVHKPIVRQRGYFIKGKYDQFQRNIPFSAFVQAFRDLMGQLLTESDTQIQQWKNKILSALGENGQVIIEVIPELERIIGQQTPAIKLLGTAAENRFNLLFQNFTEVFTSAEHPLVIFLDDLQWADSASLKLMQLLMADTGHLLLIGAYRDNEVNPAHPLMLTLSDIQKSQATINTIVLKPLSQGQVNQLIADTLKCTEKLALPLSQFVYQKTQGNPFFTIQFIKLLYQDRLINFNFDSGFWQCDIAQVNQLAITNDVLVFMALQLRKLPQSTQQVLQLAACIGNQFDLATLVIVSEQSEIEIAAELWKALQEGLILPISDVYKFYQGDHNDKFTIENVNNSKQLAQYKFLHDRVQQAAYSLIPAHEKQATHLKIGRLLQQNLSEIEQEEKLFDIVGHLNKGQELITQPREQEILAELNLKAAGKAKNSTAYTAARVYLQTGIELLQTNCWVQQYELTLNLYVASAEANYLNGDFDAMEQIATIVLQEAQMILDKVKIYEIQIGAQTLQSNVLEAIAVGRKALCQLGVELPSEPDEAKISKALQTVATQLEGRQVEELLNLPLTNDATTQAAMQVMGMLFAPIIQGMPGLLPLLSSTMVSLSLQSGNTVASITGYAIHGMVMSAFLGDVVSGYAFGKLALNLLEKLNIQEVKTVVMFLFGCFIQHHQERLSATIPILKAAYHTGIETGNFLHASFSLATHSNARFFSGAELNSFAQDMADYSVALAQVKQYSAQVYVDLGKQMAENLIELASQPHNLIGNSYNETVMLPKHQQDNDLTAIAELYIYKLLLAYYFGNYTDASNYIAQANLYLMTLSGTIYIPIFHFYAALTHLAFLCTQPEIEQAEILALAQTHQTILHQWAQNTPMNHLHKWYLVEAERYRILGEKIAAIEYYDKAITLAKEHQFINDEALANELAAKFYLEWTKERIAGEYIIQAYYAYSRWGAKAKVADLEKRYPQLLTPILEQIRSSFSTNDTIFALESVTSNSFATSSSSSVSIALDLAAILKASQTISSEIEFEKLLSSLLHIVIENAGADKCVLMLAESGNLLVRALANLKLQNNGNTKVNFSPILTNPQPFEESIDVPIGLINTVKRSLQPAIIVDASIHPQLIHDPYIGQQQPKSILCSPILHASKLLGMLYLENNLATGAFTSDHVELLNLLCAQAAISIENAQLYERSQQHAQQLERSLEELSAAQSGLQASQQRLQLLVQQTPLAVIEWDTNFHVKDWNPAAERIFGYTKQEALGCQFQFIIPQIIQAEMEQVSVEIISQEGGNYSINENVTKDGKIIICAWYNNPLVSADGQLIGVASLADDITEQQAALRERKVAEVQLQQKAQELETALQNLQQAQLQMVQSEKMSALGNLVAGVAHEMNNPLGFISASLKQTKPTIADITEHLKLYQEIFPDKSEKIIEHAEEIDLDYSLEDLPKMINSMSMACNRLKNISTSLRTFSRADQDYKVPFNIHQGIDSTILILKHRLKANEQRPAIEVVTNYDNLPQVECFPGQLNQVFMNLLANAVDALDESNQERSFEEIKNNPNCITITTSVESNLVKIAIADNGKGINEEVKEKIFNHLFTTKAVGKGTGLGLAIARQIVEETHGGKLSFNSVLGEGTEFIMEIPV
ncbi:MAG: trifunctional serine/threonine-protein kinase/ATP-binding protein/sensor histidine kinase [Nostoc sp. CmiVER01]|uniref:trifunctional serine/threonine-protein kinase/ATP-binding protein/sensor histidine kinase n=1 Tax=Nostoc sp. CmiVER01 TaxID=3075384 RepID=UPI002AD45F3E|nr:AAA family ATPase [Nostoc sp. CmiVER01]MDZ8123037.1 AAA family ATPase [Nostoc sp. CmiVER01]